jgi:hypothetical protein
MQGSRWVLSLGFGALMGLALAQSASAQEAPAAANAVGKDVVRLKNGGLLRGTISELVPGDSVTIVTGSGKTREFPMAEVDYAGPADKDPAAGASPPPASAEAAATSTSEQKPEAYVTVQSERAKVHFDSTPPGVTFHRAASSAVAVGSGGGVAVATGYERLCTAPCDVTLPAGTEILALSQPGERFARDAGPITIPAGTSRINGSFESRAGTRAVGWVVAIGSIVGGGLLTYAAFGSKEECYGSGDYRSCNDTLDLNLPLFIVGLTTFSIGMPVGFVLAARPDAPKVQLGGANRAPIAEAPLRGLALAGRF